MSYIVMQVKELLDRHLDATEIAHRLHLDVDHVLVAIAKLSH